VILVGLVAAALAAFAAVRAAFAAGAPALGAALAVGCVASALLVARDTRRARFGMSTGAVGAVTAVLLLLLGAQLV
jgi:hypothetical protein